MQIIENNHSFNQRKKIEEEYMIMLQKHRGLIIYLMSLLRVDLSHWDDYYQEVLISLWVAYNKNRGTIGNPSGWMAEVCKRSILAYRRFYTKKSAANIIYTDKQFLFETADIEYSEPEIDAIKEAIAALCKEDQDIVNLILTGENLTTLAFNMGKGRTFFHYRVGKIYATIRKSAHKYFERVPAPKPAKPYRRSGLPSPSPSATAIDQLDKKGDFIKRWDSMKQASESLGIRQGNISHAVTGKRYSTGGYQWRYAVTPVVNINQGARVLQIAL